MACSWARLNTCEALLPMSGNSLFAEIALQQAALSNIANVKLRYFFNKIVLSIKIRQIASCGLPSDGFNGA